MAQLRIFSENDVLSVVGKREGETKLGERVKLGSYNWEKDLARSEARFVLLGLPEDIGVRANGGIGGAHTNWNLFVKSLLNIQETDSLPGAEIFLLGHFDFTLWMEECKDAPLDILRKYTAKIDELVYPVIQAIVAAGKIPVVVGGGHNNAYPIIKGTSMAIGQALNSINLDAHSDFRIAEGRHSGNGFRYAYDEQYLKKYALLALHEAYNSENIVAEIKANPDLLPVFWEDIFLRGRYRWVEAIKATLSHVNGTFFGTELDVDCIQNVLSSAATPVGISPTQAMQYLYHCGREGKASYLHLPEAVAKRNDGLTDPFAGKLLSYLVQAFIKGVREQDVREQ